MPICAVPDPKGYPSLRIQQTEQSLLTDLNRKSSDLVMNLAAPWKMSVILLHGVNKEEQTGFMLKCLENINSKALVGQCHIDYCYYVLFCKGLWVNLANDDTLTTKYVNRLNRKKSRQWGAKWELGKHSEGHGENTLQQKHLFNLC